MQGQDKFEHFLKRYPHPHKAFFDRPHITRRRFFQIVGSGVTASYLCGKLRAADETAVASVTPRNTAKNVIFILLAGAPSHIDTFDLKVVNGTTPSNFNPTTVNGINWPTGLFP